MTLISVRSVTALLGSFRCSSCVVSFFLSRDARVCGSGPAAGRLTRRAFWTMQLGFELRFFGAFPIGMINVLQSTAMGQRSSALPSLPDFENCTGCSYTYMNCF
jgi:hypothetical protein